MLSYLVALTVGLAGQGLATDQEVHAADTGQTYEIVWQELQRDQAIHALQAYAADMCSPRRQLILVDEPDCASLEGGWQCSQAVRCERRTSNVFALMSRSGDAYQRDDTELQRRRDRAGDTSHYGGRNPLDDAHADRD